jgi:hypothetical protein
MRAAAAYFLPPFIFFPVSIKIDLAGGPAAAWTQVRTVSDSPNNR